jgi:hypothetical protein
MLESNSNSIRKALEKGLPTFGASSTSSKKDSAHSYGDQSAKHHNSKDLTD